MNSPGKLAAAGLATALTAMLAIPALAVTAGPAAAASKPGKSIRAWGFNEFGQLGDGSTTNRSTPIAAMLPPGARVTAVTAGCVDSYALTAKGHVLAWGYDAEGQLGDGGTTSSDVPVRVELPGGWRASALGAGPGAAHALAIVHRR